MSMQRFLSAAVLVGLGLLQPAPAQAGFAAYLNIPHITGYNPVPGHPDTIGIQSFSLSTEGLTDSLSVVRNLDRASPQIRLAAELETFLGTVNMFLYRDSTPTGPATATFSFQDALISSYNVGSQGNFIQEQFKLNFLTPKFMFLEVPGITGESYDQGHPDVIAIQSFTYDLGSHSPNAPAIQPFTLTSGEFSVLKEVDAATPQLENALATGKLFNDARLLIYNTTPSGTPDVTLGFQDVIVSSVRVGTSQEVDSFQFVALAGTAVPEPSSLVLLAFGVVCVAAQSRWRRQPTDRL